MKNLKISTRLSGAFALLVLMLLGVTVAAMTQLAQNVEQVAMMTEQNVAVVNQTEAMVLKLEGIVDRMDKAVKQFTV